VSGANSATGTATTASDGTAMFCYTGTNEGDDTIEAFADSDGSGAMDPGEPSDTATKTWEPPAPTDCEVEGEGRLSTNWKAIFDFDVETDRSTGLPKGKVRFRDRSVGRRFVSTEITGLVISGTSATITGKGTVNGAPVDFTLEVADLGGSRLDTFRIELSDGYTADGNARGEGVEFECDDDDDDDEDDDDEHDDDEHGTDDRATASGASPSG